MQENVSIYIEAMRRMIAAGDLGRALRIGIAAYRIANTHERRVLLYYLGPNAVHLAGSDSTA
ncbi:hypothetical protein [Streptomyces flavidovirens]|uniref:hypothetical protein n=1 Tax=Streptomyces flavidovirens TaxID=67298 RepID=UPI000420006E|nr:hypothetical protein [Streptomyces flavidovirens]